MYYPAAVAAYLAVRAPRVGSLGNPGIGIFEDGYAASILFGDIALEFPATGQGGFIVNGPNPNLPQRVGDRPLASAAVGAWLNDRGLQFVRMIFPPDNQKREINANNPPSWVKQNWTVGIVPVDPKYKASVENVLKIYQKARLAIPEDTYNKIDKLVRAGFIIVPKTTPVQMPGMTAEQFEAWKVFVAEIRPLAKAALTDNLNDLAVYGDQINNNIEFWESFERYTRAVATLGLSEVSHGGKWGLALFAILGVGAAVWLRGKKNR